MDSLQCIKVCSIESGLGHKEHVSSVVILYFFNSFLVSPYSVQSFEGPLGLFYGITSRKSLYMYMYVIQMHPLVAVQPSNTTLLTQSALLWVVDYLMM